MGRPEEEVGPPGGGIDSLIATLTALQQEFLQAGSPRASEGVAESIRVLWLLSDTDCDFHDALDELKHQYLRSRNGNGANGVIASMRVLRRWRERVSSDSGFMQMLDPVPPI